MSDRVKFLSPADARNLARFVECCEDFDSGGHDVSKAGMRRLAELGAVRHLGFGNHELTAFGRHVTDDESTLPLATYAELLERSKLAAK
jgi:hypothetical protein